jgi:signal transduction histidine kinase
MVGAVSIIQDITERKNIEEEAEQYQKRLEALLLHASQLASAQSLEEVSNITLDTMTDALGYELQAFQTVENDILIIKGIRGGPQWNMPLPVEGKGITAKAAREARSILLNDVRKDPDFVKGSTESLSELAVPVISEGRVVAVLNVESVRLDAFTLRDQQLLELLANHVASALMRIWSQRDLLELRERHSVELVEGIQRVSSMVRHDLRGPLQTIMNANYLLGKDSDSFDEMREIITSSVKHANEIMEDWKKQGIDEQLSLSDIDIRALIEEILDISLIPSNIKTSMDIEPMVLQLDRVKTHRALDNLIRNAVEAMPMGGILSLDGKVDGDVYVLEIKDTGIGISRDGLSKLFTPFYTTKPNGMGLGLAFCKRSIEAHGGTIEINTTEGKGTTFTINIPTSLSFQYVQSVQLDEVNYPPMNWGACP